MENKLKNYIKLINHTDIELKPNSLINKSNRTWYYAHEIASIYKFPSPKITKTTNIAVVSFGGGLYGKLASSGLLTNSDCHKYWSLIGIKSMPNIYVFPILGAKNIPNINDDGSTMENTIDVQQIGACCPTSKLNIILYIAPNNLYKFPPLLNTIINNKKFVPSVISISWGAPEIYYPNNLLNSINNIFKDANNKGINITAATGDNGSNNGVGGNLPYADFPSSSPNVVACGGTNLICPNLIYDTNTIEIAWSYGGGAVSSYFNKPSYQNNLVGTKRLTPDLSLNADPNTGVLYCINNNYYIVGGTSIVSPAIASYIVASNINKFINTSLYASINCFNDIKSGSNGHYTSIIGYDNCTGLGSINGELFFNYINYIPIKSISLYKIKVGNNYQLKVRILPRNATSKSVTFKSSDISIATIDNKGLVKKTSNLKTKITVTTYNNITADIMV